MYDLVMKLGSTGFYHCTSYLKFLKKTFIRLVCDLKKVSNII